MITRKITVIAFTELLQTLTCKELFWDLSKRCHIPCLWTKYNHIVFFCLKLLDEHEISA